MSISINTSDFVKVKKIKIDKYSWDFISPGAGLSLELSRLAREISGKEASQEEQMKMIETMFEYYGSIFRDSTKDNSEVQAWLRSTPIESLPLIVAAINKQVEEGVAETNE